MQFCICIRTSKCSLYFPEARMNKWFDVNKMSVSENARSISREKKSTGRNVPAII